MKRGVDENNKGPMFPRLHVNDTEKGGPRAPPRNKMALYEQLSIPSQRLNGGHLPLNPNSSANYPLPPSSSFQCGVSGRGSFFPLHQTHDKINNRYSDLNNQLMQQEQKKKQEEDDFRVPIFVQQSGNKDNEGHSPISSSFSGRFTNIQRNNSQELPKSGLNQSSKQSTKVQLKETNGSSSSFDHRNALNNSVRLQSGGNLEEADNNNSVSNVGYGNSSLPLRDVGVQQEVVRSPKSNDVINGDDVSETSMVDSVSGADMTPDDVVGVIGQKHFWKARRAIVNQQRLFAVQVFELHRLIKVQRLIAGLRQPLLEDNAFVEKPQKASPIKNIPIPIIVPKVKDHHEKSKGDTREFSAENAFEKASHSSVQNSSGPMFPGYPLPPSDPRMGPWGPAHQWLIPVMSPSEGLIYKPYYPGSGYMNSGPGPPGSVPMFGGQNMVNHGVPGPLPAQPHYQWPTGFPPMVPPPAHGYFPPYGVTTSGSGGEDLVTNAQPRYKSNSSDVQVSTASSVSERDRDVLPLFPTCPPPADMEQSRVIRVVPRNAQLANESVARIFQSIQDERKRQDPV